MGIQKNSKQKQHGLSLKSRCPDCLRLPGAYRLVCCCMSWRKQSLMERASKWFTLMLECQGVEKIKKEKLYQNWKETGLNMKCWNAVPCSTFSCQFFVLYLSSVVLTMKEYFHTSPDSYLKPVPVPHCVLKETQQARRSWINTAIALCPVCPRSCTLRQKFTYLKCSSEGESSCLCHVWNVF